MPARVNVAAHVSVASLAKCCDEADPHGFLMHLQHLHEGTAVRKYFVVQVALCFPLTCRCGF